MNGYDEEGRLIVGGVDTGVRQGDTKADAVRLAMKLLAGVYLAGIAIAIIVLVIIGGLLMLLMVDDRMLARIKAASFDDARNMLQGLVNGSYRDGYRDALVQRDSNVGGETDCGPVDLGGVAGGRHATVEDGGTLSDRGQVIRASDYVRHDGERSGMGTPKHAAPVGN